MGLIRIYTLGQIQSLGETPKGRNAKDVWTHVNH